MLLADGRTVPLTAAAKKKIMAEVDTMAASALRCLAFAQKTEIPAFAGYNGTQSHPVRIAFEGFEAPLQHMHSMLLLSLLIPRPLWCHWSAAEMPHAPFTRAPSS